MSDGNPNAEANRRRQKLLERRLPTANRSQAFREIHQRLATAAELFQHHGDGGRAGVFQSVTDIMEYFSSLGIPRAALEPLAAITKAIADADNGTESAIFKPDRTARGGKPPAKASAREFEGYLAAITECCITHCQSKGDYPYVEPGCKLAAKLIKSKWPSQFTFAELKEIRERIQQSAADSIDRIAMTHALPTEIGKQDPLAWAKALLDHPSVSPPPGYFSV